MKPERNFVQAKREVVARLNLEAEKRIARNDLWHVDGVSMFLHDVDYDYSFGKLLAAELVTNFQSLIKDRKNQGQNTHVLDLFGGGYFLRDLTFVDSMTGVRLFNNERQLLGRLEATPPNKQSRWHPVWENALSDFQNLMTSSKRTIIEGDLYKRETWNQIKTEQAKICPAGFDLIVCRPWGAFYALNKEDDVVTSDRSASNDPYVYLFLRMLNSAYDLVSSDGGEIYTEIPDIRLSEEDKCRLAEYLKKIPGIQTNLHLSAGSLFDGTLHIKKLPNSQKSLI